MTTYNYDAEEPTTSIIERLGALLDLERTIHEEADRLELELTRRMERDDARMIPHDHYDVTLTPGTASLDLSRVRPLLENESIVAYGLERVFTPSHQETITVPERWSLRDLQTAARALGGTVAQMVKDATLRGPSKLRIQPKKEKP